MKPGGIGLGAGGPLGLSLGGGPEPRGGGGMFGGGGSTFGGGGSPGNVVEALGGKGGNESPLPGSGGNGMFNPSAFPNCAAMPEKS